jgi:Mn2+/Fe2+ NRAMP family transporter
LSFTNPEEKKTMARADKKLFFVGAAVGAVVAPIVMFSAGWIVTSGASQAAAKEAAQAAIVENLTPICLSQFPADATRGTALAKLKALSQWNRADYVTASGWATMPGGGSANGLVASECARRLAALEK